VIAQAKQLLFQGLLLFREQGKGMLKTLINHSDLQYFIEDQFIEGIQRQSCRMHIQAHVGISAEDAAVGEIDQFDDFAVFE
jgi:hypothetical protein